MKRYLGTVPILWSNPPVASGLSDAPTPPELTFEESFFFNLPESYEPWSMGEDPLDNSNGGDPDEDVGLTSPGDDPAEIEEEETLNTDVPDAMSPPPAAATNRPRRTVVKPARFRVTGETMEDMPGQAHSTLTIDAGDLANEPNAIDSAPQAAIDTCEDSIVIEAAEIDIEFGDESAIELASYF